MVPSLKIDTPSFALAAVCDFITVQILRRFIEHGEQ